MTTAAERARFAEEHVRRFGDVYQLEALRSELKALYPKGMAADPPPWMQPVDPHLMTPQRLAAQVERFFPGRGATSKVDFASCMIEVSVPPAQGPDRCR